LIKKSKIAYQLPPPPEKPPLLPPPPKELFELLGGV
jgi:hypothetical protein